MADVSVIILTFNEKLHVERCIRSLTPFAKRIFLIDCGSTDGTRQIAESLGAVVLEHPWVNYAQQLNWGLQNAPIDTAWTMRMDCDEYVLPELAAEIERKLGSLPADVTGVNFNRRVHFMGRWIRRGGYYPTVLLRIWRTGKGTCEQRWMDEHIQLADGRTVHFDHDIVDENLNDLTWWTAKHNSYATREAIDMLRLRHGMDKEELASNKQAGARRWLKQNVYARVPAFVRPVMYFLFRYFVRLGFLDGKPALVFHTLQAGWYRFLVDAKIYEIERQAKSAGVDVPTLLRDKYGVKP